MKRLLLSLVMIIFLSIYLFYNKETFTQIQDAESSTLCDACEIVTGPVGPQGPRGYSAYSIAKSVAESQDASVNFPSTSEWIEGLRGPRGPSGPVGVDGDEGPRGVHGLNAYNVAKEVADDPNVNFPSKSQWVHELRGPKGDQGPSDNAPVGVIVAFFPDYNNENPDETELDTNLNNNTHNIPSGWAICDGRSYYVDTFDNNKVKLWSDSVDNRFPIGVSKQTPDLRGRFILSAGSSFPVNADGGEYTHTLTETEMPSHDHGGETENGGSHDHGGETESGSPPAHSHERLTSVGGSPSGVISIDQNGLSAEGTNNANFCNADAAKTHVQNWLNSAGDNELRRLGGFSVADIDNNKKKYVTAFETSANSFQTAKNIGYAEATHSHTIQSDGAHNHTITSAGGNIPHNNMPPYYTLIYIMKISTNKCPAGCTSVV